MKLLGHPLHLMLVHFPSALFPVDLICSGIAYFTGDLNFYIASKIILLTGVSFGWLAFITGLFDLLPLMKHKQSSMKKALIHGGINSSVLIGFTVILFLVVKAPTQLVNMSALVIGIKSLLVLLMLCGNYLGGSLVLKDKVLD